MSSFLNYYMNKDLYVVEFFRDKGFYIWVENSEDDGASIYIFHANAKELIFRQAFLDSGFKHSLFRIKIWTCQRIIW